MAPLAGAAGLLIFLLGLMFKNVYPVVNFLWLLYTLSLVGLFSFYAMKINKQLEDVVNGTKDNAEKTFSFNGLRDIEAKLEKIKLKIKTLENTLLNNKVQQAGESLDLLLRATTDALTGVSNREHLNTCMDKAIKTMGTFSVIIADIDYFKRVNDTNGHDAGDMVLKRFAQLVRRSIRPSDHLFRFGGEEFIIIANTGIKEAVEIAERVREEISRTPIEVGKDSAVYISASFGVAERRQGDTGKSLLKRADEALYRAKTSGRNRVCVERPDTSEKAPFFSGLANVPEQALSSERGENR